MIYNHLKNYYSVKLKITLCIFCSNEISSVFYYDENSIVLIRSRFHHKKNVTKKHPKTIQERVYDVLISPRDSSG